MNTHETHDNWLAEFSFREFAKEILEGGHGYVAERETDDHVLKGYMYKNVPSGRRVVLEITNNGLVLDEGLHRRVVELPSETDPRDVDIVVTWGLVYLSMIMM